MFEQTFKNIDDVLHKDAGCTSELDYTEQSSWLLFLKYLDALERDKAAEAELEGNPYDFIIAEPNRWERSRRRPPTASPTTTQPRPGRFLLAVDGKRPTYTTTYCASGFFPRVERDLANIRDGAAVLPTPVEMFPRNVSAQTYEQAVKGQDCRSAG